MQKVSTNDGSPCLVSLLRSQHRVFLAWIALCAIWGSTWLVIKIGLTTLPPFSFAAMRFLIAAVALFGICMVRGKTLRADRAKDYVFFALTGFLTFSVNYGLLFWGEQRVSSGLAAILQATIPLFGMAFAHFLIPAEPIKARRLIGAILGLIGVAVICAKALNIDGEVAVRGGLALVVGAASTALANVLIKSRRNQFDPAIMAAWQMSFGLLPLAIAGWVVEGNPLSFAWNSRCVACLLYLAIVGSCIAFCLFYWLINRISVTNLQAIPLITPPLAVTLGWVVIGEKLSGWALFGAVVVLAGVGLIVRTASCVSYNPPTLPVENPRRRCRGEHMKRSILTFIPHLDRVMQRMLLSVMLVVGIIVPNQLPAAIAPSETPDERELIAIEHKWCEAYLTSDADYLDAVMSSTYVQTNVRGEVTTKAQEVAEVRNHIIAYEKFETSDLNVKIYGDAAVVTGQTYIKAVVKASGRRIDATIRITDTFVKQQGKWQIVASQTTLLPKLRG